jgi:5-methylcytosine-specific restriction endonuclease McrA
MSGKATKHLFDLGITHKENPKEWKRRYMLAYKAVYVIPEKTKKRKLERSKEYEKLPETVKRRRIAMQKYDAKEHRKEAKRNYARSHPAYFASRSRLRNALKQQAIPSWLTRDQFLEMENLYYQAAKRSRETGVAYHVDHIIPLNSPVVCGLHVPWNLQILEATENMKKHNKLLETVNDYRAALP